MQNRAYVQQRLFSKLIFIDFQQEKFAQGIEIATCFTSRPDIKWRDETMYSPVQSTEEIVCAQKKKSIII